MRKNKKIKSIYDRQMVRKILRNRLGTNKIRNIFHDKSYLKSLFKKI